MRESKASRTLLKSPPELWSEVSTATALQRHMDQFGEIRITKLEPETAVAWEGERARGTITLEVSGWGTKVSLTAEPTGNGAINAIRPEVAGRAEPEPVTGLVEPEGVGERAEPERLGTRVEPEPARYLAEPVPEPEPVPAEDVGPPMQRPRWTQRVAETVRKWFSPPLEQDAAPPARPPEPVPEQPAPSSTHVAPQFDRVVAPPTPPAPPEPALQQEPPPQIDEASTAALDATLDSLGQAHHRPFSRA